MRFSDFFGDEMIHEHFSAFPETSLPETEEQRKEHILAIAQVCHDNGDMLWQDDWFNLADNHLEPLFTYYIQTESDMPMAMFFFPCVVEASCNFGKYPMWRDAWYPQEDWEHFRKLIFHFVFAYAEENGFGNEVREKFPGMWNGTEQELVQQLLAKPWV